MSSSAILQKILDLSLEIKRAEEKLELADWNRRRLKDAGDIVDKELKTKTNALDEALALKKDMHLQVRTLNQFLIAHWSFHADVSISLSDDFSRLPRDRLLVRQALRQRNRTVYGL